MPRRPAWQLGNTLDKEAERWKAEYRSLLEEQEAQQRDGSAMRKLLQDMLRAVLNCCSGWSASTDEEIEVLRIQVEQAQSPQQLDDLQRSVNRVCNSVIALQRDAKAGGRDLEQALTAVRDQFAARLADEPALADVVASNDVSAGDAPSAQGLEQLAGALVDAFRQLSAQKAEAERFVSEVTATLASLESWASDGVSRVDAQRVAHRDLHADVDREVDSLKSEVEGSTNIDDLKGRMRQRFAAIAERIRAFRDNEEEKLQAAEQQNAALNNELEELKVRTAALDQQLHEQRELLLLDALTGVHSRFAYERRLDEEIAVGMRTEKPLCYALWDIDHFKRINDQFGHQAGDAVLRQVAGYLARYTRAKDFVARIGGEEFVILFPETTIEDATRIAEKLRALIAAAEYNVEDQEIAVTISCGLSLLQPGDGAEQLYKRADAALYAAKDAGRNRCIAA